MITLEKAKEIAKEICADMSVEADLITEYSDAFVISKKDDTSIGGVLPFAIMKKDGETINMTAYIDESTSDGTELSVSNF